MPFEYQRPDRHIESLTNTYELQEFMEGWCHLYAGTLNRMTGWPIVVLRDPNPVFKQEGYSYVHFLVEAPDGLLWDASGALSEKSLFKSYDWIQNPYLQRLGDEENIRKIPYVGTVLKGYRDDFFPGVEEIIERDLLPVLEKIYGYDVKISTFESKMSR